ncbi:LysR family transcriptional regulator [Advenella mimigardefordensis]|uniref:Putative transcriptional regulator, LysR family n=1 Tax=Advenella mimigardefordensis (strain DSM 17166 / LMG 22922 / DPN7) TaxID=1247726 RepID=W0PF73_ADVMD|nr:LysR family transcriptional regulator [Advenella mimigardefordensis]AHG63945.1 putative transcriptional regulator, LysR family [Advenella mimigardefordensis DPN7]
MTLKPSHILQQLEFRNLIRFCHLCQTRSLAQTAAQLGIARSGMSDSISTLEQLCGLSLFRREARQFIPNDSALVLSHHFLRLCLLEDFACRYTQSACHELGWIKIRFPYTAYRGQTSAAFFDAVLRTQRQYQNTLFCIEFYDSYLQESDSREDWAPPWPRLAQFDIVISPILERSGENSFLKAGGWLLLHSQSVEILPGRAGTDNAYRGRVCIPRMPWALLQQATQVCAQLQLDYEYDDRDYLQVMMRPPQDNRVFLVNQLSLDATFDANWQLSPVDSALMSAIELRSYEDHPGAQLLLNNWRRVLDRPASGSQPFSPQTTLKQWHYFGLVAGQNSIRKAAAQLYMAQPALSTQLKRFESVLGSTLIARHQGARQLALTPSGTFIFQVQQGMKHLLASMQSFLHARRLQQHQRLSLGVVPSADVNSRLSELIVNQVAKWQVHYPDVRLEIVEDKQQALVGLLRSQHIHLAFVEDNVSWLVQEAVSAPEPIGLVMAPDLAGRLGIRQGQSLDWRSLRGYPLVLPRRDSGLRKLIDDHCVSQNVTLMADVESDSLNINQRWIAEGKYGSLLPRSAVESLISMNKAWFIALTPVLGRTIRLSYLKNRQLNPVEKNLIDYLRLELDNGLE